ncbi:MAG: hypothetical protein HQL06_08735 [Nitrospirae bacterium]|nr:hypothetical protein [Nitrospirota bacterium]
MSEHEEKQIIEAYSKGILSRREIERSLGYEVDFATVLQMLRRYHLPLPHHHDNQQSVGIQLISQLASRHTRRHDGK